MSFASSQRDLFEDGWLEFVVRVYWLKARFLALQVGSVLGCAGRCPGTQRDARAGCLLEDVRVHMWGPCGLSLRKWDLVGDFQLLGNPSVAPACKAQQHNRV